MQNLQKYTNLTNSIQQLDPEPQNGPQQILNDINQNKRINELMMQLQRSDVQIQQLQSQNQVLLKEKQAQQLQLNQYEQLKSELQEHLGKIKNFEQQLKQQYQERNEKDIQQVMEHQKRKYHVLIERLEHHFNARYNENSDIIEFIDDNFRSIENNFVGLQRQIQHLQNVINSHVSQPQQPDLLTQKADDQQQKQYHTFLNTQINILAQQITHLQMEKQILKQICNNQETNLQDVKAFLNNKVHQKTSKKLKIVKLVIRFCIILKHNVNKQVQKSFNQKYFIVNVDNMKQREYIRPENQYQYINILNKNMNNMLQVGKTRIFVNFKSPYIFSAIKAKFDDIIIQNEALQQTVNSNQIEKDNMKRNIDKLNDELIDMRLQLQMLDKSVSLERYQQLLNENALLNDKIVDITAMYNKQEREIKLLQREKEKTDLINNHNAEAINELIELRRNHTSVLAKCNELKMQLEEQKQQQEGQYDYLNKMSKTFDLSGHTDPSDKSLIKSVSQLIQQNTHEFHKSRQLEEEESLRHLTEKYVKHSLYNFQDKDRVSHNINQLQLGYEYLQRNTPVKDRIFSQFDHK